MADVVVIGAAGYAGGELIRLLLGHPGVGAMTLVDIQMDAPTHPGAIYPYLKDVPCPEILPAMPEEVKADAAFLATPDGVTMKLADGLLARGMKVIDFSGDTRLRAQDVHKTWYGIEHTAPHLLERSVYGLPELHREALKGADLVANPGCYATCCILAAAPAVRRKLVDPHSLVFDAKSGLSGAGRHPGPAFHFPEMRDNLFAYKIGAHKHTPEIEQELGLLAGAEVALTFVPQVVPLSRGILVTAYATLAEDLSQDDLAAAYAEAYGDEPFVRVMEGDDLPKVASIKGSNFCDIGVRVDARTRRAVIVAALDNLVKGASGQAVQNLNVISGMPETEGLLKAGFFL
jgi:N-acetyl-gamma-glutamyl-phosphate reductase